MFNSIITDPPYGFRAGARRLGVPEGTVVNITPEQRDRHNSRTIPYKPDDVRSSASSGHSARAPTHQRCVPVCASSFCGTC